jgi:hypothetical protein
MKSQNELCYIYGRENPDTRDHVPPKCLLPKGSANRLTLPAHKNCNNGFSKDEEYFRDLVGGGALEYPDGKRVYQKTKKSWQRPQGRVRYDMFMQSAKGVQLMSKAGIYLGKAIGIRPDITRVDRVAIKIAQGIIYNDTRSIIEKSKFQCIHIPSRDVPAERKKEMGLNNPFWLCLSSEEAYHDNFSASVAALFYSVCVSCF